jgi:hypothetical protein
MPILCEGKSWWNGKPNPVTLVAAVVARNRAVQLLNRFALSIAYRTTNPEPMPTRLRITWKMVKVDNDIPSITKGSFQKQVDSTAR